MIKRILFSTSIIWGCLVYSVQACFDGYESYISSQSFGMGRPSFYFKPFLNKNLVFILDSYQSDFTVSERQQSDFPTLSFYDLYSEEFNDRAATYMINDGVIKYYQIFERVLPLDICVNQSFISDETSDKTYREGYLNVNVSVPEGYSIAYYEKRSRQQIVAVVVLKLKYSPVLPLPREIIVSQTKVPLSMENETKLKLEQYIDKNIASWVAFDKAHLKSIE